MKKTILLSFALLLAATPLSPAADTIYVGPGYAYNTIQAAINAASNGDTVIIAPGRYTGDGNRDIDFEGLAITVRSTDPNDPDIVATTVIDCNGTEEEPHRGFSFTNGEDSNSILNGFTIVNGYSDHGGGIYCKNSSPIITNCNISQNVATPGLDWGGNGGGIYSEGGNPTISNCTITSNYAVSGGGILCYYSSPMINNCIISDNTVQWGSGGGIVSGYSSSPTIINCTISSNNGGGIYCSGSSPTITNCTISSNNGSGISGGGVRRPTITNCTISGNSAANYGGGLYNCDGPITNCTITGNSAAKFGGGLSHCGGPITNCTISGNTAKYGGGLKGSGPGSCGNITNCTISGNTASHGGGGLADFYGNITNCTISGNSAGEGGGIFDCEGNITNCTITGNSAAERGGGLFYYYGNITNCIVWDNWPDQIDGSAWVTYTYSNVQGGWLGDGNIDADPCFVSTGYWADVNDPNIIVEPDDPNAIWIEGDYHLLPDSSCIDAGDNTAVPADTTDLDGDSNTIEPIPWDLDGNPRFVDRPEVPDTGNGTAPIVDMGAFEANYIEVAMKFTPKVLNPNSKGRWVKAHFVLPDGFAVEDVDVNTPAKLCPLGIESDYINVFINEDDLVEIEIGFGRAAFCGRTDYGPADVTVIGLLTTGQYFYGTDTIRIITHNLHDLAVFASYWLDEDCGAPDWCNGFDLDRDSIVNFIDFALFDSCCVEIITQ